MVESAKHLQWVRYDVPCIAVGPRPGDLPPLWCIVYDGSTGGFHCVLDVATGNFRPLLIPVYTCPVFVPVPVVVVVVVQARVAARRRRRGRGRGGGGEIQSQVWNRHQAVAAGGSGGGRAAGTTRGGYAIGSGTGVYLPRKSQGMRNRHKSQFLVMNNNNNNNCENINPIEMIIKKQDDSYVNHQEELPPDINLPSEWTY